MPAGTPEQVHQLFEQAFNARDIDALMELYEPNAVLVPQPGRIATGTEQIRAAMEGFLALNGPIRMTHLGVVEGAGLAVVTGTWTVEGTDQDGQPITVGGLASDVVRRGDDGAWRFAIDSPFTDAIINSAG